MSEHPDVVVWRPHPGPQTKFLESPAYEALYGGQAGGGKSDALLYGGLRQIEHKHYKALLLRRTFPELRELIDRSLAVFTQAGGSWSNLDHRWKFPSGATYQFGYCSTYQEVLQYQGQQFTWIGFDELGQLGEERIWLYLMSRNRAAAKGLVRMMRATANPGGPGHAWIKRRFISRCPSDGTPIDVPADGGLGRIRGPHSMVSRAFVKATLRDNPTLMALDPQYEVRLHMLPDLEYRWLALGDWDAGAGLGLQELQKDKHLIPPMETIPSDWTVFGAFDWGYSHPFCFGIFCCDHQGKITLIDSISGRHLQPPDIAHRILDRLEVFGVGRGRMQYVHAGHDCWADHKARGERVPTLAEQFNHLGFPMRKANISRIAGVQNMRRYIRWKDRDPLTRAEIEITPQFQICETPNNMKVYECLETRVSDPDDLEDILKTDADDHGDGGDDAYDMVRYGLASRPIVQALQATIWRRKFADRAPHFNIEQRRLERMMPAAELDKWFKETGRSRFAAPIQHRVPRRASS